MAGNLELVGSFTASGVSAVYYAVFNNIFSADYDDYKLILSGGRTGSGNPNNLEMRMVDSAGGIDGGGVYDNAIHNLFDNATSSESPSTNQNAIYRLPRLSTSNSGSSFEMDVYSPFLSQYTFFNSTGLSWHHTSNLLEGRKAIYVHKRTGSYTGVALLVESSPNFVNILDVRLDVYGYKKDN